MQINLGVRFCKAFISKNYALDSLADSSQGRANQANLQRLNALKKDLNLNFIPPIERRRLSDASKIAFSLLGDSPLKMPIVFSSQKGEINRCFAMLNDLATHNITSPTAFSLSVLNSTPALLAIAQKNHSEILAVSAVDCLEYGLVNAYALLCESAQNMGESGESSGESAQDSSESNGESQPKDCLVISYEEILHSKDICAVIARVSLDSALPQITLKLRNDSAQDSRQNSRESTANLSSNLAFLYSVASEKAHYQNGDFVVDLGDFLKGFSFANL